MIRLNYCNLCKNNPAFSTEKNQAKLTKTIPTNIEKYKKGKQEQSRYTKKNLKPTKYIGFFLFFYRINL